ncbi:MAG: hypothetical protein K6G31_01235 [Paludibacteraceae bacterium]|nr:hypothetical protein [Paludibacteraceae bacterium]
MKKVFRKIEDLLRALTRENDVLVELFKRRKQVSLKLDDILQLMDNKMTRMTALLEYGLIVEGEDHRYELGEEYLKFFESVLEVNDEINSGLVNDLVRNLQNNIEYFTAEDNALRKEGYSRDIKQGINRIKLALQRNVVDLKRNVDNTYKNEPNYKIKKSKLKNLDIKLHNIQELIKNTEEEIDNQPLFRRTMDEQMHMLAIDLKDTLKDCDHTLINIQKEIIIYINQIDEQSKFHEKLRKLKYLNEQFLIETHTDIRSVISQKNDLSFEKENKPRIKLSLTELHNSDCMLELIKKVASKKKHILDLMKEEAPSIPKTFLDVEEEKIYKADFQEIFNAFSASQSDLYDYVVNYYKFPPDISKADKISYFCQIANLYADELFFSKQTSIDDDVEYTIVTKK